MYVDRYQLLSNSQVLTATGISTDWVDLSVATPFRNIGQGEPLAVFFSFPSAADASSGNETYQFQIIQSANSDMSAPDVLVQTDVAYITRTMLVPGFSVTLPIPPGMVTKRYLGARYVLGGTTPQLTVSAVIIPLSMVDQWTTYQSKSVIL